MTGQTNGKRQAEEGSGFAVRRVRLLDDRGRHVAVEALSAAEAAVERSLLRPLVAASAIDPAASFLESKADYDASELLGFLRRMPKGAVLHTHGIASGDFSELVDRLRADERFFVWQGTGDDDLEGRVQVFAGKEHAGEGWVPASSLPKERLCSYLTLPAGLGSVAACWDAFGKLWRRVHSVAGCVPFYFGRAGFLWHILEQLLRSNVVYAEIKEPVFATHTNYDGTEVSDDEWTDRFRETVVEFQAEHPSFLGARLVLVSLKAQTLDEVRRDYRRAVRMKERLPDFVAGFDLAGPEDTLTPISAYSPILEEEVAAASARGIDLPLLLHAGETNVPSGLQIVDAVAVGCERIGHGFALARHPTLIDEVIARGTLLECCPISNQVLGYFPNLAAHSIVTLLRLGVPVSLSPDDPGMWHYADVSYDFAAAAKAWDLSLLELKALARNSLAFSTLRGSRKEAALAAWAEQWRLWVDEELRRAGVQP